MQALSTFNVSSNLNAHGDFVFLARFVSPIGIYELMSPVVGFILGRSDLEPSNFSCDLWERTNEDTPTPLEWTAHKLNADSYHGTFPSCYLSHSALMVL